MAARPSLQGYLRLSPVTCPLALYPATLSASTSEATTGRGLAYKWRLTMPKRKPADAAAGYKHKGNFSGCQFVDGVLPAPDHH